MREGESTLEACMRMILATAGNEIDFREELAEGESILDFVNGEVAGEARGAYGLQDGGCSLPDRTGNSCGGPHGQWKYPASDGVWPDKCAIS